MPTLATALGGGLQFPLNVSYVAGTSTGFSLGTNPAIGPASTAILAQIARQAAPAVSATAPLAFIVIPASNYNTAGVLQHLQNAVEYTATSLSGSILGGLAVVDAGTDRDYGVGAVVSFGFLAKHINDLATLATRLNAVGHLVDNEGAAGDGATNDDAAIAAAVAKAVADGGTVVFGPKTYAYTMSLGVVSNLNFVGTPGVTKLLHLDVADTYGFLSGYFGAKSRFRFHGIYFSSAGSVHGDHNLSLDASEDGEFEECAFDDAFNIQNTRRLRFTRCVSYGTRTGVMQAGVMDPPAVAPTTTYKGGINFAAGCRDVTVDSCYFPFAGVGVTATSCYAPRVTNSVFLQQWYHDPIVILRSAVSAYSYPNITVSGGLTAMFASAIGPTVGLRRDIASGTASSIQWDNARVIVPPTTNAFASAKIGDVLRTASGEQAVVTALDTEYVAGDTTLNTSGWVSVDTFLPTAPPVAPGGRYSGAWRLSRMYSCAIVSSSDTVCTLYSDPVNIWDGERMHGTSIDPTGWTAEFYQGTGYSGVDFVQCDIPLADGNVGIGSRSDMFSAFDCRAPRFTNNRVDRAHEVGFTLTGNMAPLATGNTVSRQGGPAFWVGGSDVTPGASGAVIADNAVYGWGMTTAASPAVEISDVANTLITGNTVTPVGVNGLYGVRVLNNFCTGTRISANDFSRALVADLHIQDVTTCTVPGDIVATGCAVIGGVNTQNVAVASDSGKRTFLGTTYPVTGGPYVVGDRVKGPSQDWVCTVAGSPGTWVVIYSSLYATIIDPTFTGTAAMPVRAVAKRTAAVSSLAAAVDWSLGDNWEVTPTTAATTVITFSNVVSGRTLRLRVVQPSGGSALVSFAGVTLKWPGGSQPTLATVASHTDTIMFTGTGTGTADAALAMADCF